MANKDIKQTEESILEETLGITSQGVYGDYGNTWYNIAGARELRAYLEDNGIPPSSDEEAVIKKSLGRERLLYRDYIHAKNPKLEEEIIQNSNESTVNALNELAESYNFIREKIAEDLNIPLAMKYVDLVVFLIKGHVIREEDL